MPNRSAEGDIERARRLRDLAKKVKSSSAKDDMELAADRLERRAAKKVRNIGRPRKPYAARKAIPAH